MISTKKGDDSPGYDNIEPLAGVLLVLHWIIVMSMVKHVSQEQQGLIATVLENVFFAALLFASFGFYLRNSYLFSASIPFQMIASGIFIFFCLENVYVFGNSLDTGILSIFHLSVIVTCSLYDCYVSVMCTKLFYDQTRRSVLRSPNATFVNVFSESLLGTPPLCVFLQKETPRCRGASNSSIEGMFDEYQAIDAVTLV